MTIHLNTQADLEDAIHALVKQDPRLKPVLEIAGMPALRQREPGFAGLAHIVCGQQLSTASAAAIWGRLSAAFDPFDHEPIRKARTDRLGRLGLSGAKIKTLKNIAREITAERLNLDVLANEDADAAHNTLTALHGIGPWTADVYLLFCLGHGDAWPAGDIAMQEAIKVGLGLKARPTAKQMAPLAEPWRPLRGAAAHLWWSYYRVLKKREGVHRGKICRATRHAASAALPARTGPRAQSATKSITARTAGMSTRSGCASSQRSATLTSFCGATRTRSGSPAATKHDSAEMPRPARTAASMSPCDEQRITTVPCRVMTSLQRASRSFEARSAKPMTLCPFHSSRRSGNAPPRRIVARGVEAGAETADPAADQILLAAVDRAQHDVGLAAAHAGRKRMGDDLELDMIVRAQKRPQPRHQPVRGQRRADRQLDHAAGLRAGRRYRGLGAQRGRRHRLDMLAQLAALRGQRQAVVGAREQPGAELAFQRGDLAADRRMAGAQLARRGGEAAGLGHRDEGLAEVPVHRRPPSVHIWIVILFNIEQPAAARPAL